MKYFILITFLTILTLPFLSFADGPSSVSLYYTLSFLLIWVLPIPLISGIVVAFRKKQRLALIILSTILIMWALLLLFRLRG